MVNKAQRFLYSFLEYKPFVHNSKIKTQQNIDRIMKKQQAYLFNTKSMIMQQSARFRSASATIAPKYDQQRLRENTFRGHRSLRNRTGQLIVPKS